MQAKISQNSQLQLKLELEQRFRPVVRRLFTSIRLDFRLAVIRGQNLRATKYASQWETILKDHYRRVQKIFRGIADRNTKQDDDINDEILAALLLWADQNAPRSAERITMTTQKNIDDAVDMARQSLAADGITQYTNRELATVALAILTRKFGGREQSIITTETQGPAESTKLIESFVYAGFPGEAVTTGQPLVSKPGEPLKEWVTMGDDRVRDWHRDANGQRVPISKPFVSHGEKLRYPGDPSMGASLKNIINCRCSSFYSTELR